MSFREALSKVMETQGSIRHVAMRANVSNTVLGRWLDGEDKAPPAPTVLRIAAVTGSTIDLVTAACEERRIIEFFVQEFASEAAHIAVAWPHLTADDRAKIKAICLKRIPND